LHRERERKFGRTPREARDQKVTKGVVGGEGDTVVQTAGKDRAYMIGG